MSHVTFDTAGRAGVITLRRPEALNAISEPMVHAMAEALIEWAKDDRIERIAIRADGGRAFSAGGDIRKIYDAPAQALTFFEAEYRHNVRVATYPKPYIALVDGIVMGGGVGVSLHASHRIGGENLAFAMPEVGIGFFPDIGAAALLAAMDDHIGHYVALTGNRLGRDHAADPAVGLVTHAMRSDTLDDALDRIAGARDIDPALSELVVETEPWDDATRAIIPEAFSAASPSQVLERLADADNEAAAAIAKKIARHSPTSLELAHRAVSRATAGDVTDAVTTDFRILARVLEGHDFFEGIRAAVIDKDQAPRWSPADLGSVDLEEIDAHFTPPPHGDLNLEGLLG
ncbi:MAG: enoyl-CoA hydratase/isomerase family protein [Pseudomonadota bacterium]